MASKTRPSTPPYKRILVIGASGFIGGHLFQSLKKNFPKASLKGFSSKELDLVSGKGLQKFKSLLNDETVIVHSASRMKRYGDTIELFQDNVTMTMTLLSVLKTKPCALFVYISSQAVFGEEKHNPRIREDTPLSPSSYYGLSKKVSERLIEESLLDKVPYLILRPPLVYGPGDTTSYTPSGFLFTALSGEKIVLWGDGSERRDFLFINDLCGVTAELMKRGVEGSFNMVGGTRAAFRDAARIVRELVPNTVVATRSRTKKKIEFLFSGGRIQKILPNYKYTSLERGLFLTLKAHARTT